MNEYIVSPVTVYDDEHQLFGTKVGLNTQKMPLHYTCWGKTEWESRQRADELTKNLSNKNKFGGLI